VEEKLRHWIGDLRRRQYINWRDFWPYGAAALERENVRRRLDSLPGQIAERLQRASARERSPNTVPEPSSKFVGRRDEMHKLLTGLLDSQIGAITAVNGIPGIGKSMLAFAYAWGYGFKYPGGRFLIQASNLSDLASGVIALAEPKGVALTDQERQQPELALAKVKKAFEDGPPSLLVVDNLDDPALLGPQSRARSLPQGRHIHILVTTRVSPEDLPKIHCLPLDALEPQDAVALLNGFRPIADSPQDDEWKAALEIAHRLGCHALALEVVGVYLREQQGKVSYRQFAEILKRDGVSMMEEKVGPRTQGKLEWHKESCIGRLLEPTLAELSDEERRAVEYAALLPPDNVPLPWLRALLLAEFPDLAAQELEDPIDDIFRRLERLRLVVPLAKDRDPNSTSPANTAETHLARMHRLVQDVVQRRVGTDQKTSLEEIVSQFASERAEWIRSQVRGGPISGYAWELSPLQGLAFRMIERGKENERYTQNLLVSYDTLGYLSMKGADETTARLHFERSLTITLRLNPNLLETRSFPLPLALLAWGSYS
jgi:hypothetical protein